MEAYPVKKPFRRERFEAVMAGIRDYSAEELDGEILDLYLTQRSLNNFEVEGVEAFLGKLREQIIL